jgi:hypothetical protein
MSGTDGACFGHEARPWAFAGISCVHFVSNGIQSASASQAFSTVLKSHLFGRQFF